ncbi:hypothetical protein MPSEU_000470800 [Mayamaea pseudoterrestris]|nr:hypothetical protein MPSEU_000470800 [Mayamaea pseudoterrestris]
MKGSSNATRRYRGSPLPRKLVFNVPIGSDDDEKRQITKRRKTGHFMSPLVWQRTNTIMKSIGLKNMSAISAVCLWMVASAFCVGRRHPRSKLFRSMQLTTSRRLDFSATTIPMHSYGSNGQTSVLLPKPLSWLAHDGMQRNRQFGGLHFGIFESSECPKEGCRRQIYHDYKMDEMKQDREDPEEAGTYDNYYAFDDDRIRNPYVRYSQKKEDLEKRCRRVSWHRFNPTNCNNLHELDFLSVTERGGTKYIGAGAYRQVFLTDLGSEKIVIKKFGVGAAYDTADFEYMRMDTIVAERLSSRPEIVNIYASCGLANLNEPMVNGNLEMAALPHGVRAPNIHLDDKYQLDPQNRFLPSQKLLYALEMAEAVSTLHSYPGGVMVHDDIQMSQFLFTPSMHLKLNDFNRAEIMTFNDAEKEYCKYTNNPGHGDWRAPEEYHDHPLNEKIDVYSLGNSFYALLTGVGVFYDESDVDVVQERVMAGELPYIDTRWKKRSFAETQIIEIIERMWVYDPDERVDIFEVVAFLRNAWEETQRNYMHEDEIQLQP